MRAGTRSITYRIFSYGPRGLAPACAAMGKQRGYPQMLGATGCDQLETDEVVYVLRHLHRHPAPQPMPAYVTQPIERRKKKKFKQPSKARRRKAKNKPKNKRA